MTEITDYSNWEKITKINKGWSKDAKFLIETKAGDKLLLRLSDIERYEAKKKEYEIIQKYAKTGVKMSMPLDFGSCGQETKVYMLLTWIEGEDLEAVLPRLSEKEQYELGRSAGEILKKIHAPVVEPEDVPTIDKRQKKLAKLKEYEDSDVRIADDETAIAYVKDNIGKICTVPPVYQHGDFHPGNLIYMPNGEIGVIDFNRWEVGDPYEEFYKLESFGTEYSIPYCVGEIDAYFNDEVPEMFWETLAVYVAHASLFSIKWAKPFGQDDIDSMVVRCEAAFAHYDRFNRVIPSWYTEFKERK